MNEEKTNFLFAIPVEQKNVQMWAHITSAVAILYAIDLLTDYNPVKDLVRSVMPAINVGGTKAKDKATSTSATVKV